MRRAGRGAVRRPDSGREKGRRRRRQAAERGPGRGCGMRGGCGTGRAKAATKGAAGRPVPRRLRARSRRPGPSAGRAAQARDAPHGRPARDRTSHRAIRRSGIARRETVSDCGGYSARARRAGWDREATGAKAACTRPSDRRPRDRPLRRVRARPRNRKPRLGSRAERSRTGTGRTSRKWRCAPRRPAALRARRGGGRRPARAPNRSS